MEPYCTTSEAAKIIGCDPSRVRQLLRAGSLVGKLIGRDWLVDRKSARAYKPASARGYPRGRRRNTEAGGE